MDNNFTIIEDGNVGDKAQQLIDKTTGLKEIGFHSHRRTVLSQPFIEEVLKSNGVGESLESVAITPDLEQRLINGTLSPQQLETIERVSSSYDHSVLGVRSSAQGDSRGTGTYESGFAENRVDKIEKELLKVIASYFSEDAILFRKDAQTGEGFGVIIEPMVGQEIEDVFAPVYSGYGYSSTSSGDGYISIVPGLFGGVSSRDGVKISARNLETLDDHFIILLSDLNEGKIKDGEALNPLVFNPRGDVYKNGIIQRSKLKCDPHKFELGKINLREMFSYIKKAEEMFKAPQYFEFAITLDNDKPKYWIIQISDMNKRSDPFEFSDEGKVLLECDTVTGSGIKHSDAMVSCFNFSELEALREFNRNNVGYVLRYSSRLTQSVSTFIMSEATDTTQKLRYRDFNNAAVVIESQDAQHAGNSLSHFEGQIDLTGKFFGVLNGQRSNMSRVHELQVKEDGLNVYRRNMKITASESYDKMQVMELN
jgi:hypothetical protein